MVHWNDDGRTDADLLRLARSGDNRAVAVLYTRHAPRALAYARSFKGCDPDDVVADAFSGLVKQFSMGAGPETNFRSYLMQAVRNAYVSEVRRHSRCVYTGDHGRLDQAIRMEPDTTGPLETVSLEFRRLAHREQIALWMTTVEGYTLAETGHELRTTEAAAGALVYRARKHLREAVLRAGTLPRTAGSERLALAS